MLYPLTFQPIFKERIWGGRELERLYNKTLPPAKPIGESWEICDRPRDISVIVNGPLAGKNLHWLMDNHRAEILGSAKPSVGGRFPLLCKILDAREKLSLQVHPPASKADQLEGEPKTEMWHIVNATPDATLYAGLKRGVTRSKFQRRVGDGTVADCFHQIPVKAGDAMFLPSGRVHAIGGGLVIFEIQQNSDTTYRVFDWNRTGLDGKPRELHAAESLACIDFDDFEPKLVKSEVVTEGKIQRRTLVSDPLFNAEAWNISAGATTPLPDKKLQIVGITGGAVEILSGEARLKLSAGQFGLIPAILEGTQIRTDSCAELLRVETD